MLFHIFIDSIGDRICLVLAKCSIVLIALALNAPRLYFLIHKNENAEEEVHNPKLGEGGWNVAWFFSFFHYNF